MDLSVETEAIGSQLTYRENQYPYISRYALSDSSYLDTLTVPIPWKDRGVPELLKSAHNLWKGLGEEVLVVGCVAGPITLVVQLLGIQKALYLAIDNPDQFVRILDFAAEVIIRFGEAQIEAGVHLPIVFNPSSSNEVLPDSFFR